MLNATRGRAERRLNADDTSAFDCSESTRTRPPDLASAAGELDAHGYVMLRRFLQESAVQEVRETIGGLFRDVDRVPARFRRELSTNVLDGERGERRIVEIVRPLALRPTLLRSHVLRRCARLARALKGPTAAYVFDHAICKPARSNAATEWHQDEAFVESQLPPDTLHFWIPLQDVSADQGCMHYIPASHRLGRLPHHRARTLDGGTTLVTDLPAGARPVAVPARIGDVLVHLPRTLHYAGPNLTDVPRNAWIIHFGPFGLLAKLHPREIAMRLLRRFDR